MDTVILLVCGGTLAMMIAAVKELSRLADAVDKIEFEIAAAKAPPPSGSVSTETATARVAMVSFEDDTAVEVPHSAGGDLVRIVSNGQRLWVRRGSLRHALAATRGEVVEE